MISGSMVLKIAIIGEGVKLQYARSKGELDLGAAFGSSYYDRSCSIS